MVSSMRSASRPSASVGAARGRRAGARRARERGPVGRGAGRPSGRHQARARPRALAERPLELARRVGGGGRLGAPRAGRRSAARRGSAGTDLELVDDDGHLASLPSRGSERRGRSAGRARAARGFSMPLARGDRLPVGASPAARRPGPGRSSPRAPGRAARCPGVAARRPRRAAGRAARTVAERELRDLLLREREADARPQRPAVGREELEGLLERVHDPVELERAPEEAHRRRDELRPGCSPLSARLRRDEVGDLLGQLADVVDRLPVRVAAR